jgi:hypothetical protein
MKEIKTYNMLSMMWALDLKIWGWFSFLISQEQDYDQ